MENWNESSRGGDATSSRRLVIKSRIALISDHASPLADLGSVDSGGQNVYVAHVAGQLARLGYAVDVFSRRDGNIFAHRAIAKSGADRHDGFKRTIREQRGGG